MNSLLLCSNTLTLRPSEKSFKWFLAIILLLSLQFGYAQSPTGTIHGTVKTQSSEPVAMPNIPISEIGKGTNKTDECNYRITGIPMGKYTLIVKLIGYTSVTTQVEIHDNETSTNRFDEITDHTENAWGL